MKILQYNWIDYLASEGGGVTVYVRNLMESKAFSAHAVYMLSSGFAYSLGGKPFWREVQFPKQSEARRFEIVNAKTPSPASACFGNSYELDSLEDDIVFLHFIETHGPFDIIHFHNLEGLSLSTLKITKKNYPNTKFIFSVHNYFIFCPQVNMWLEQSNTRCRDFMNGERCVACGNTPIPLFKIKRALQNMIKQHRLLKKFINFPYCVAILSMLRKLLMIFLLFYIGTKNRIQGTVSSLLQIQTRQVKTVPEHTIAQTTEDNYFALRRKTYISTINEVFDMVLCVSERVRQICCDFGLEPQKIVTDYIGTRHVARFSVSDKAGPLIADTWRVTLTYLGYARCDKGFFFLLDALELLPFDLAKRITLQLGVKTDNSKGLLIYIQRKCKWLHEVHLFDGYTHDDLQDILSKTSLGIIPVLWEDNLPQVAIEMHCHGIPLLCSNLGGASELSNNDCFIFKAGVADDFIAKLSHILTRGITNEEYWGKAMRPIGIETHAQHLVTKYESLMRA